MKITENNLRKMIQDIIRELIEDEEQIDETSVTGNVAGFQTPYAFTEKGQSKKDWVNKNSGGWKMVGDEEDADEEMKRGSNWVGKKSVKELNEDKHSDYKAKIESILLDKFQNTKKVKALMDKYSLYIYDMFNELRPEIVAKTILSNKVPKNYLNEKIGVKTVDDVKKLITGKKGELDSVGYGKSEKFQVKTDDGMTIPISKFIAMKMIDKNLVKRDGKGNWVFENAQEEALVLRRKFAEMKQQIDEEITQDVKDEIKNLLQKYNGKEVPDDKVHAIADKYKISPHELESYIYSLASAHLNEGRRGVYHDYRDNEEKTTRQKIGESMREVREKLKEIEKQIDLNIRLKQETGIKSNEYWKRTGRAFNRIGETLHRIQTKLRSF